MRTAAWVLAVYFSFGLGYMAAENKYYRITKAVIEETRQSRKESATMKATAKAALDLAEMIIKLSRTTR